MLSLNLSWPPHPWTPFFNSSSGYFSLVFSVIMCAHGLVPLPLLSHCYLNICAIEILVINCLHVYLISPELDYKLAVSEAMFSAILYSMLPLWQVPGKCLWFHLKRVLDPTSAQRICLLKLFFYRLVPSGMQPENSFEVRLWCVSFLLLPWNWKPLFSTLAKKDHLNLSNANSNVYCSLSWRSCARI